MRRRVHASAAVWLAAVAIPALCAARGGEGPTIRGRLTEPVAGEVRGAVVELFPLLDPHARALVELGAEPAPAAAARVPAGADGAFALAAPGPGPWRLRVEVPGWLPHERIVPPVFDVVELEPVPLIRADEVVIAILGPDGEPLPRARLETVGTIRFGWRPAQFRFGATREDGRTSAFRPLEHGGGLSVSAWAPGLAESEAAGPRDAAPLTITVPAAEPRLLELRDAEGRPLTGAVIRFDPGPGDHGPAPWPAGVTDEQGRVAAALPAGAKAVLVETGRGWAVSLPMPADCGSSRLPCTLDLPAPLALTGEVRDAVSSRPLGGVLVWSGDEPDRAVTTDGRGRFVLRFAPGSSPRSVAAAAAGYAAWERGRGPREPFEPLLVALDPAMRIAGRVVDPDGAPLEGARVRLKPPWTDRWTPHSTWLGMDTATGGDGRFQLPSVAAGSGYRLRADLPGYAPAEVHPSPATADDLEIVLTPGGAVAGRLVDRAGEPVPGARARVIEAPESGGLSYHYVDGEIAADAEATAGADGRFTVRHLTAGRYELLAVHPDHATRRLPPIQVPEGETVDLGTIELAPGGRLAGRVVDPGGAPVEGVSVTAGAARETDFEAMLLGASRRSDFDGHFELTGLTLEEPLRLTASHADYPAVELTGIELPLAEPLLIELRRGASLFGRVLGPHDQPIEGARVWAEVRVPIDGGSRSAGSGHAVTGADGGFEIEGLGAGALRLTARAEGYPAGEVGGLTIGEDGDVGPIEIRLAAGAEVSGRVRAPDGSPAPGTRVSIHTGRTPAEVGVDRPSLLARPEEAVPPSDASALSDARGEFVARGVALGPATIEAEHERLGDAAAELVVRPGANSIELILDRRGRIEGRVVAGAGPVAGAMVELTVSGPSSFSWRFAPTDAEGRFLFRWLTAGDYRLDASAPGLLLDGPPVTVTLADAPGPLVELILTAGEEIAGRLLGVPEAELLRVRISAHSNDVPRSWSASPGPDGHYRLTGLEPGRWTVSAYAETGRSARGEVEVAAGGGPYRLDLDLGGGLTLTGSVRVDGEPLAGAAVAITGAGGGVPLGAHVETAFDGTFRAEGLEPGDYRIVVGSGGSTLGRRELTLSGDGEIHLDLPAAALSGRVVDAEGAPVAEASVLVQLAGQPGLEGISGMASTDAAGRFALSRLAPDRYEVSAAVQGKPVARATVSLEAGDRREVELRLEAGSELILMPRLSGGGQPHLLTLFVLDAGDVPVYVGEAQVASDGAAVFSDVPAGAWRLVVHGLGTAMIDAAAEVPGPPMTVVLPPPTMLEIEAPALGESAIVPLTIVGADGRPPAVVSLGRVARLFQGRAVVLQLPPGTWTVHAVGPDGREYLGTAVTAPGAAARLVLE